MKELAYGDQSNTHKSNTKKSIKRYFKWEADERGGEEWDSDYSFSTSGTTNPRDYLSVAERKQIREAALEYGSIPAYGNLSPEERDHWKAHLAQRLGKPKESVSPDDWEQANGWKYTSMTWASLDAGLRPVEVERAKTTWVDTENQVLRIPKEESSKNRLDPAHEHDLTPLSPRRNLLSRGGVRHQRRTQSVVRPSSIPGLPWPLEDEVGAFVR
jgi:hypothetical protein